MGFPKTFSFSSLDDGLGLGQLVLPREGGVRDVRGNVLVLESDRPSRQKAVETEMGEASTNTRQRGIASGLMKQFHSRDRV